MAARAKSCLRFLLLPLIAWMALALAAPGVSAQQAVVQRVEIIGNRRVPRDTLRARMFVREGDAYDEAALRRDFQALWNTQYFEDIRLEVEDSPDRPNARIIVFYVKERPIIRRIEYCKMPETLGAECKKFESIPESEILDRFKERKVGLSVESSFDPTRIKKAEVALKELLSERGRQFAVIRPTYERIPATNAIRLIFNIEEGPKVKVGKIEIEGNTAFSDRKITRAMRHSRPYAIPLGITHWNLWSKTYDRRKLSEDLEIGIRSLYQDNGYFKVLVNDPILETVDIHRAGLPGPWPLVGRKRGKATNIKIPIEEGDRFRMGRLFVRSSDPDKGLTFNPEFLQAVFPLREGDIFAVEKVRKALQDYQKLYGEYGFIDFTAQPLTDVDSEKKVINLTLEFDEQKQFYVRRIEFAGNTTTRDKVIRRELLLDEGSLYNSRYWELSLLRLNQLDYFEQIKPEHTETKRNLKDGSVDLLLKVKEKGKQSIGLTGGVSGLAGSFIGFSYQTNNFLGLGETLTFSAEFGDRQRNFLFGFTEPYLFDRPITAGFTIFSSRFSFDQSRETSLLIGRRLELDRNQTQNYDQNSTGFTVFASYPLRKIFGARIGATYSFSRSNISAFSDASRLLFENLQFRGFAGPSALRGIRSSRLTPTFSYNTVDSVLNPTRGKSLFVSLAFEGGPLQGNVNTITPVIEAKYFRPVNKGRNVLGFRLLTAFATGYGSTVLPPFNRFYLGGEDNIRGFDIRTVTPIGFIPVQQTQQLTYLDPTRLDANGNPIFQAVNVPVVIHSVTFPGGDTQAVGNMEYRIPIVGPVSMALYYDVGLVGALRRNQLQLDPTGVNRLRQQFPTSTFENRLNIASGTNFKLRSSTGVEFVVQLPVVNAPFRLYWAYNLNRLRTTLRPPAGDFFLSDEVRNSLPPGVLEGQILPTLNSTLAFGARALSYVEPLRTFRFTVSRTF
jgi:outer membrane protein insertion porin family